jgi:hypothetical protein
MAHNAVADPNAKLPAALCLAASANSFMALSGTPCILACRISPIMATVSVPGFGAAGTCPRHSLLQKTATMLISTVITVFFAHMVINNINDDYRHNRRH